MPSTRCFRFSETSVVAVRAQHQELLMIVCQCRSYFAELGLERISTLPTRAYIVRPRSLLKFPNERFETPPARAFSKTPASAGTTFSFSDPAGRRPKASKSSAKLSNSRLTICSVAVISDLQHTLAFNACPLHGQLHTETQTLLAPGTLMWDSDVHTPYTEPEFAWKIPHTLSARTARDCTANNS